MVAPDIAAPPSLAEIWPVMRTPCTRLKLTIHPGIGREEFLMILEERGVGCTIYQKMNRHVRPQFVLNPAHHIVNLPGAVIQGRDDEFILENRFLSCHVGTQRAELSKQKTL